MQTASRMIVPHHRIRHTETEPKNVPRPRLGTADHRKGTAEGIGGMAGGIRGRCSGRADVGNVQHASILGIRPGGNHIFRHKQSESVTGAMPYPTRF
jgi:hypothetical protein